MTPLPRRTAMAPRGRLRGAARYSRTVHAQAARTDFDVGPDAWWALWHHHADWRGWGNVRWSYRREHVRALCTVYRAILDRADTFHTPFQAWISLDEADAGLDATFLHTPNPNSRFPTRAVCSNVFDRSRCASSGRSLQGAGRRVSTA